MFPYTEILQQPEAKGIQKEVHGNYIQLSRPNSHTADLLN